MSLNNNVIADVGDHANIAHSEPVTAQIQSLSHSQSVSVPVPDVNGQAGIVNDDNTSSHKSGETSINQHPQPDKNEPTPGPSTATTAPGPGSAPRPTTSGLPRNRVITNYRLQKAKTKSAFTKSKHRLTDLLSNVSANTDTSPAQRQALIIAAYEKFQNAQTAAMQVMELLAAEYTGQLDDDNCIKIIDEMETLEEQFDTTAMKFQAMHQSNSEASIKLTTVKSPELKPPDQTPVQFDANYNSPRPTDRTPPPLLNANNNSPTGPTTHDSVKSNHNGQSAHGQQSVQEQSLSKRVVSDSARIDFDLNGRLERLKKSCNHIPLPVPPPAGAGAQCNAASTPNQSPIGSQHTHCSNQSPDGSQHPHRSSPNKCDNQTLLGQDMWKQLKRVSIPVFSGNKANYANWNAAFTACIDQAPATPEYKLLQLRQYLAGEALKTIEKLGHSGAAYQAAKDRLDRKYGGARRQVALQLDELENFPPIRTNSPQELEKFSELLDVTIINFAEFGLKTELSSKSLYARLLSKMPESMVTNYHRYIFDKSQEESVQTLREWVNRETEFRTQAYEAVRGVKNADSKRGRTMFAEQENRSTSQFDNNCCVCGGNHGVWRCENFKQKTLHQRWDLAKEKKLCFRCLSDNHRGIDCPRSRPCGINKCTKSHNRLLHQTTHKTQESKNKSKECENAAPEETDTQLKLTEHSLTTTLTSERSDIHSYLALRTVPVILKNGNKELVVNALLDDASTRTYVNSDVVAELGVQGISETISVSVLNGRTETFPTTTVELNLLSVDGSININMSALTTNRVTGNMRAVNWNSHKQKWPHLGGIQFPKLGRRPTIDLLIGIDHLELHSSQGEVRGQPGEPVARRTPLGWTCIGNFSDSLDTLHTNFAHTYFVNDRCNGVEDINKTLQQFWDIEAMGTMPGANKNTLHDETILNSANASLTLHGEQYQIGVPWHQVIPELPDNYSMARNRLVNTEKKLLKNPKIASAYSDCIIKYVEKGYIRKVPADELPPKQKWYLPHFPVIREDKATTKTRIVFDASAKCGGVSLNDIIYQGPKLQRELFDVLLRYRKHPIALVCDIEEMYLRIKIPEKDRPFHRFLWRDLNQNKSPDVYEFSRVVFGVNSSPFMAQYVAQEHARNNEDEFPQAAKTILRSTYMDDSMDSVPDDAAGIKLYEELSKLWKKAGMRARKWLSNSQKVLENIPDEDRATQLTLSDGSLPSVKALGILWKAEEDILTFQPACETNDICTKRVLLKTVASLFDPLGFLAPFTIRGKVLLQEAWLAGIDWDETPNEQLVNKAKIWVSELIDLPKIQIPRSLCSQHKTLVSFNLHTFVDASKDAYAAVIYARNTYTDESVSCRIVASKTRVAPLKAISIPRMELMAAVLGTRLTKAVSEALEISINSVTLWSDSTNVLYWIKSCSRKWKPFVSHRVGEIQSVTNPEQWRYISTAENPADIPTRGRTIMEMATDIKWWSGPSFLQSPEESWPTDKVSIETEPLEIKKELCKANKNVVMMTVSQTELAEFERYSNWMKLIRVYSWIKRFVDNCRADRENRSSGELSVLEIHEAEIYVIKSTQKHYFASEWSALKKQNELPPHSKLVNLYPTIDENEILRCRGRLENADFLPHDVKYPVILPRKSWVTKLIVKHHHELGNHKCGTNQTLASLSSQYWIESAREVIRQWERECCKCVKLKANSACQLMAPLPKIRLNTPLRAFARIAVDYAGPFLTIQGRGRARQKRYLCLFTCLLCRAVHLEISFGLDTDSFLNCFNRMVNRRGVPLEVLSDNAGNFVAANKELKELVSKLDNKQIQRVSANRGVKWNFTPPLSPHFGGVHETMIKAAKRAMNAVIGNADITDEELITVATGAEALVNSRPLTYQSASPEDDPPLTPNHFLHGQAGGQFAPDSVDSGEFNIKRRWRRLQEIIKHFWHRWMREWLPGLNARKKWNQPKKDLIIGDIVLVITPSSPRGHWPLGRVVETCPGQDGHVRVVKVKVGQTVFTRAVNKLCLLDGVCLSN